MRIRLVFVCFGLFLLCAESPARGDSQGSIVRDSSLPGGAGWGEAVASGVDPSVGPGGGIPDYLITPELGEQHGDHLFHSFSHFGVGEGEIAQFTDNGLELGIERIVVRVTGGETSNVAGLIRSSIEGADFYLLNPDGIVFMETGGIDGHTTAWPEGDISQSFKGASFYLSTADQLKLGEAGDPDAGVFGVSNLEVPWSTGNCCTAGPTSFVFVGAAPAMIDVGSGYISRGGPIRNYAAMTVEAGQTFYAVAGEVSVTANLSNQQGSIVLLAVGDAAVDVPAEAPSYDFSLSGLGDAALVTLGDNTINTSSGAGSEGGRIVLRGGKLMLRGSTLYAAGKGSQPGIDFRAAGAIDVEASEIWDFSSSEEEAGGMHIEGASLALSSGASLNSTAGDITIFAQGPEGLMLSDGSVVRTTADEAGESLARVGNIDVTAASLSLSGGGQILSTVEKGSTAEGLTAVGEVGVEVAGSIVIKGFIDTQEGVQRSSIQARSLLSDLDSFGVPGGPDPGGITVHAGSLELSEGGLISTSSSSEAPVGSIVIHADSSIRLTGGEGPLAEISAYRDAGGSSEINGDVTLVAPHIELSDGAVVTATTTGTGDAGEVTLLADTLRVSGRSGDLPSAVYSETGLPDGGGRGGDVNVIVQDLVSLDSGGEISVKTRGSGNAGTVTVTVEQGSLELRGDASIKATQETVGSGKAGNIELVVGGDVVLEGSNLTTQSPATAGGNITIDAQGRVELVRGSSISTDVGETGTGGDIVIRGKLDPDGNPLPSRFVLLGSSDIIATAQKGDGGDIDIAAAAYLASADSVVDASSKLGIDGVVELNAPVVEVAGRLDPLPASFLDVSALLRDHCASRRSAGASSFTVEGRTGLPPAPDDYLPSSLLRVRDAGTGGPAKPRDQAALLPLRAQLADFDPGCGSRELGLAVGG